MATLDDLQQETPTTDEWMVPGSANPWPSVPDSKTSAGFTEADLTSGSLPQPDYTNLPDDNRSNLNELLANLQRPLRSYWGGTAELYKNKDLNTAAEAWNRGAQAGWQLKTHHNPLTAYQILDRPEDVQGPPMGFPEWLGRSGAHLAADVISDPLNVIVPGARAIGKMGGISQDIARLGFQGVDALAGTEFGKKFFNRLPKGSAEYDAAQAAADTLRRVGSNESILKMAAEKEPAYKAAIEKITEAQGGVAPTDAQLATAFEYWNQNIPKRPNVLEPAVKKYAETGQMDPLLREQLDLGNVPVTFSQQMKQGIVPGELKTHFDKSDVTSQLATDWLTKYKNPEWLDQWAQAGKVPEHYGEIIPIISEMKAAREAIRDEIRAAEIARGVEPRQNLAEDNLNYMPQMAEPVAPPWTGVKNWFTGKDVRLDATGGADKSRGIYQFLDNEGNVRAVGNPMDPRTGVRMTPDAPLPTIKGTGKFNEVLSGETPPYYTSTGEELVKHQAPLVLKQQMAPYLNWEMNPMRAFTKGIQQEMPSSNYYKLYDTLEKLGLIEPTSQGMISNPNIPARASAKDMRGTTDIVKGSKDYPNLIRKPNYGNIDPNLAIDPLKWMAPSDTLPGSEAMIPKPNWRALSEDMPGGKGYQAPKTVANWLENQYAPDPYKDIKNMGPYRALQDYTQWWKNTVLPYFPAWTSNNVPTNLAFQYLHGTPAYNLPKRAFEAGKVEAERGAPVFEGMSNADLRNMFTERGQTTGTAGEAWRNAKVGGNISPDTFMGDVSRGGSPEYGSKMRNLADTMQEKYGDIAGGAMRGVARAGEEMGRLGKMGFWAGSKAEGNTRMATAIDYLKRNEPNWTLGTQAEREAAMNRAIQFTNEAQVDYAKTPFEQLLGPAFPFYSWTKGSVKSVGKSLLEDPRRLNRYELAKENLNTPMPQNEKEAAGSFIQQGEPATRIMGIPVKSLMGMQNQPGNSVFMMARSSPVQEPSDLLRDFPSPKATLGAAVGRLSPALTMLPSLMTNVDTKTGRPIDQRVSDMAKRTGSLAQTGGALFNPLFGDNTDYSYASRSLAGQKIPAGIDYAMGQVPGGRIINDIVRPGINLGYGLATGKELDPQRPEQSNLQSAALNFLTGMKAVPNDYMQNIMRLQNSNAAESQLHWQNMLNALQKGDFPLAQHEKEISLRLQLSVMPPKQR